MGRIKQRHYGAACWRWLVVLVSVTLCGCAPPLRRLYVAKIIHGRPQAVVPRVAPAHPDSTAVKPPPAGAAADRKLEDGYPATAVGVVHGFLIASSEGHLEGRLNFLAGKAHTWQADRLAVIKKAGKLKITEDAARSRWGAARRRVELKGNRGRQGLYFKAWFFMEKSYEEFTLVLKKKDGRWKITDVASVWNKNEQ